MLFHLLLSLVAVSPALDSLESAWLDTAMFYLNITPHDLSYPKIWVKSPEFLTEISRRCLNAPLTAPAIADSIEDAVLNSADEWPKLVEFLASLLDENIEKPAPEWKPYPVPDSVPEFLRRPLAELLGRIQAALSVGAHAFDSLTDGEIDTLLSDAIYFWTDEDDTLDDTLRGWLNRELGVPAPFPPGDTTSIPPETLKMLWKKIDLPRLFDGYALFLSAVKAFLGEVGEVDTAFQMAFRAGSWRVCLGGNSGNVYQDCDIVIDLGGDDIYRGRAGAGLWNPSERAPECGLVIDLGGNDLYLSDEPVSLGAGVMGYGFLYDRDGNDIYRGSHVAMGAGLFGCGGLVDGGGDDIYRGGFFVQGAGNFGIGWLIDAGGNDDYQSFDFAQGLGGVKGLGLLLDRAGDDRYYAGGKYIHHPLRPQNYRSFAQGFALGWRPDFAGGIGLLFDLHGNDSYYSEIYGQGVSYWLSFAALIDDDGDDSYYGIQYMQGAGIHLSTGVLIDRGGDDGYFSRYGPSQGEGHDLAVGWLIDKSGADRYFVSDGQGVGLTNSVGIFVDSGGDDVYSTQNAGEGWANWRRNAPGIGIFLDLQGNDRYPAHLKSCNNRIWLDSTSGIGIDVNSGN